MATTPVPTIWPCINYSDALGGIAWICDTFGFQEILVVKGDQPDVVVHSQIGWPEGGGVMIGSAGRVDSEFSRMPVGAASVYVVTDRPDELFARAESAGAEVVAGLRDEDYGSRGFTVRDPEGNLWSFGTYRGEALP